MNTLHYYDKKNIDDITLPQTSLTQLVNDYWIPQIKEGSAHAVENTQVTCAVMVLNEKIIPIVINESCKRCSLTSPSCYFFLNGGVTFADSPNPLIKLMFAGMNAISALASTLKFDKSVQINQWLLPSNPQLDLNQEEVNALLSHLKAQFPYHAWVFKGVTAEYSPTLFETVKKLNAHLIKMRWLYIWDKEQIRAKNKRELKGDEKKPEPDPYTQEVGADNSDAPRFTELYTQLYRNKHSHYSPAYNTRFFSSLISSGYFQPMVLRRENCVDAFYFYADMGNLLMMGLMGYDTQAAPELKLYRRSMRHSIMQSENNNKPICLGAGSGPFKRNRGAVPINEFDACFVNHLPFYQQLLWRLLSKGTNSKLMEYFVKGV